MIVLRTVCSSTLALCVAACSASSSPSSSDDAGGGISPSVDADGIDAGADASSNVADPGLDAGDAAASMDTGSVPANDATLVLHVPADFAGTTRELDVIVSSNVPVAGPPAGILYQEENPTLTAGEALTVHGDATGIDGSYYVVVVLYMQGGGQFTPTNGVDYETQSPTKVTFAGAAVDIGTMNLELAGADAGP
jgi:hypothetical protein